MNRATRAYYYRLAAERFEEFQNRPTYAYRLLNEAGEVIYVGMTCDVERRVREHRRKVWGRTIVAVEHETLANRIEASRRERELILEHLPRHNNTFALEAWLSTQPPRTPAASCAPVEESPPSAVERPPTRGGGH